MPSVQTPGECQAPGSGTPHPLQPVTCTPPATHWNSSSLHLQWGRGLASHRPLPAWQGPQRQTGMEPSLPRVMLRYQECHGYCCYCSVTKLCLTLCNPMNCSMPGPQVLHHLLELIQTHVHQIGDAIQPSHPLPPPSPPALNLSSITVLSRESALRIRQPKYWSFSFSISPSSERSELISFRMDWLDFLAVQGTLKSLLQHHSSKASILWCSAFFMVQLSHPDMSTGKTIAVTRQTFVG